MNSDEIIGQLINDADGINLVDSVNSRQILNKVFTIVMTGDNDQKQYSHEFYHAIKDISSGSGHKVILESDNLRIGQHCVLDLNESV